MGDNTKIQWTDASWPVINGCRRVSPGCGGPTGVGGCYAERLISTRLRHMPKYSGLAIYGANGPRWTGESRLWEPDLVKPLRWTRPRKIFVADMGDLFFEEVTDEEIAVVFGIMAACPQHTFQVLTKRAERMREWFQWAGRLNTPELEDIVASRLKERPGSFRIDRLRWPLPNVWLGVSVEDQKYADARIPSLLATPAAVRFVSYEPALGPVDFRAFFAPDYASSEGGQYAFDGIDQVIVGGESGNGARPFEVAWARSTVQQCKAAGVAAFVKQLGANPIGCLGYNDHPKDAAACQIDEGAEGHACPDMKCQGFKLADSKGGDMAEWPPDLRVREFPR